MTEREESAASDDPRAPSDAALEDRARDIVSHLATEEYDAVVSAFARDFRASFAGLFPETFAAYLRLEPVPIVREHWRALTSLYGPFEEIVAMAVTSVGETKRVTATLGFREGTQRLQLTFDRAGDVVGFEFPTAYEPPTYADEIEFTELEMTVETEDLELGGTLSFPMASGSTPGVVLVHGAGPTDRDYTTGPNKFFTDLAWGLASNGIAVLRYDKRNAVADLSPEEQTLESVVVDDAVAAVDRLIDTDAVDSDRIFVVGHSVGGTCAPKVATEHGNVAGIVNLDGALARSIATEVKHGITEQWEQLDDSSEYADRQIAAVEAQVQRIEAREFDPDESLLGFPGAWWESALEYDEERLDLLQDLSVPLFVARTGRDLPETVAESFGHLSELLTMDHSSLNFYTDLNHYFQRGATPSSKLEAFTFRKPPAETVVTDLATWITETGG